MKTALTSIVFFLLFSVGLLAQTQNGGQGQTVGTQSQPATVVTPVPLTQEDLAKVTAEIKGDIQKSREDFEKSLRDSQKQTHDLLSKTVEATEKTLKNEISAKVSEQNKLTEESKAEVMARLDSVKTEVGEQVSSTRTTLLIVTIVLAFILVTAILFVVVSIKSHSAKVIGESQRRIVASVEKVGQRVEISREVRYSTRMMILQNTSAQDVRRFVECNPDFLKSYQADGIVSFPGTMILKKRSDDPESVDLELNCTVIFNKREDAEIEFKDGERSLKVGWGRRNSAAVEFARETKRVV